MRSSIKWGGRSIFVSMALAGEPVGIAETPGGPWVVRFADLELGLIERGSRKLLHLGRKRRGPGQTNEERETRDFRSLEARRGAPTGRAASAETVPPLWKAWKARTRGA